MATSVAAPVSLGRFVWFDLVTSDPDAAISFYTKIVGWTTSIWNAPTPYTMWATPSGPVGGVVALGPQLISQGVSPHWLAFISTPDCDATVEQVTTGGGQVRVPSTDIPDVGRFAIVSDPQGAAIAAFTPRGGTPKPDDAAPGVQQFSWHELATTDAQAAFAFYHTTFGWEKTSSMDMGPDGTYQMYGQGGRTLGGMYNLRSDAKRPPAWQHYIRVDDVDRAAREIPGLGGTIVNGPMDIPGGGRILQGIDPQDAAFALHSQEGE